jgi:hypothetical protein
VVLSCRQAIAILSGAAGAGTIDIVLATSGSSKKSFRALEQGVSLVRHTSHGLSLAVGYQGVLGAMDHFTATDREFVVHVPTECVW